MEIKPIAYIRSSFPEKFGIPRQSGLAASLRARVVFEPEFADPDALRGLEGFSHIWLIWEFSANRRSHDAPWQPVVRPPRLGGNCHMGVFATRSPFRPNPLGLSCVQLESIESDTPDGPVLNVRGADLMDGTPIYDIKPYIRYADSFPDSVCGYVENLDDSRLEVRISDESASKIDDPTVLDALVQTLSLDPRPSYHDDPARVYGLSFEVYNVRFKVSGGVLEVISVELLEERA